MSIPRLIILQIVLLSGLSVVFLLPKSIRYQPAGVKMELPEMFGEWYGQNAEVTTKERSILSEDTEFSRKDYTNGRGDHIFASVVLSGFEMSASIHHPECCLPAQGWTLVDRRPVTVKLPDAPGHSIHTIRLHNVRPRVAAANEPKDPDRIFNLSYYWFVGCTDMTDSHFQRMIIDARDRLFLGYSQRWAYITVTANITRDFGPFGRTEPETDKLVRDFIAKFAPQVLKSSVRLD